MGPLLLDYARPSDEGGRHVPWWVSAPMILMMLCFVLNQGGVFDELLWPRRATAARQARAAQDVALLSAALDVFCRDTGRLPTKEEGLAALVMPPPATRGWRGPYLKRLPADPWGLPYSYRLRAGHDGATRGEAVSAGPDGKFGTADDVADTGV